MQGILPISPGLKFIYSTPQYCSGDKIENEMGGARSTDGEEREVYRVLVSAFKTLVKL
jgi:hypothetical protein